MGFGASLLRTVYRLSGVKKAFALPEDRLLKAIEKANRGRGFFLPSDHKAYYEKKMIGGFPCLVVRAEEKPVKRAVLFFFGGGMIIGPDKGDAAVLRRLCFGAGCDVWFPIYPLCTEYCITESYDMAFECYRQMVALYGGGNVSTCGFSSGGALACPIICSRPHAATFRAWAISTSTTAPTRCSTARCRSLSGPVPARTCPIPSPRGRGWCTATVCCRITKRRRRTSQRSWKF